MTRTQVVKQSSTGEEFKMTAVPVRNISRDIIRKLLQHLFKVICFFGCCVQLIQIIGSYLEYATVTNVNLEYPYIIEPSIAHLCFRYTDLIDIKKLQQKSGKKIPKGSLPKYDQADKNSEIHSMVTIADIFHLTPPESELIEACEIRKTNESKVCECENRTECYKYLDVSKYFMQEFICYDVHHKEKLEYLFELSSTEVALTGVGYTLLLRKEFRGVRVFQPIVTLRNKPTISRSYSAYFNRNIKNKGREDYRMQFQEQSIKRLGKPRENQMGLHDDVSCIIA